MPLRSAERSTLVPQVIEQLRTQVATGEWPIGTRLPPEPELAAQLGVGRNTLREAVLALVHAGLLERRQGSGTYVVGSTELSGAVARRLAEARLAEVVEVRRAFEVEAARSAAARRTDDDLVALDDALSGREAAWTSGDAEAFVQADVRLHQCVVAAAHNTVLAELYGHFGAALAASISEQIGPDLTPDRYVDHQRLVDAIRRGDAESAAHEAGSFLEDHRR